MKLFVSFRFSLLCVWNCEQHGRISVRSFSKAFPASLADSASATPGRMKAESKTQRLLENMAKSAKDSISKSKFYVVLNIQMLHKVLALVRVHPLEREKCSFRAHWGRTKQMRYFAIQRGGNWDVRFPWHGPTTSWRMKNLLPCGVPHPMDPWAPGNEDRKTLAFYFGRFYVFSVLPSLPVASTIYIWCNTVHILPRANHQMICILLAVKGTQVFEVFDWLTVHWWILPPFKRCEAMPP